jgi:MoxR-like ATPase
MPSTQKYRLIVSLDRKIVHPTRPDVAVLVPYANQEIPGADIPTEIDAPTHLSSSFTQNHKYVVTVNPDCTEIYEIVQAYSPGEWVNSIITEVNKFNKDVIDAAGREQRQFAACPAWLFMDEKQWEFLLATVKLGLYPLITGPTGCGKTVTARAVAEALGYDFYPVNCGSLFKPKSTLIGTVQASEGSTHLYESEFLQYFKSDRPTIIYLDELSRIPSAAANMLFPVLDREQNYLYVEEQSKRVYKGENVIFICAANFGVQYVDARRLDAAFMNRFIPVHMSYLSEQEEIKLLKQRHPSAREADLKKLVKVANKLRENAESLGSEVSHRHTIDTAGYLSLGFTVKEAVKNVIINLFVNGNDDRRTAADQMIKSII